MVGGAPPPPKHDDADEPARVSVLAADAAVSWRAKHVADDKTKITLDIRCYGAELSTAVGGGHRGRRRRTRALQDSGAPREGLGLNGSDGALARRVAWLRTISPASARRYVVCATAEQRCAPDGRARAQRRRGAADVRLDALGRRVGGAARGVRRARAARPARAALLRDRSRRHAAARQGARDRVARDLRGGSAGDGRRFAARACRATRRRTPRRSTPTPTPTASSFGTPCGALLHELTHSAARVGALDAAARAALPRARARRRRLRLELLRSLLHGAGRRARRGRRRARRARGRQGARRRRRRRRGLAARALGRARGAARERRRLAARGAARERIDRWIARASGAGDKLASCALHAHLLLGARHAPPNRRALADATASSRASRTCSVARRGDG